MVIVFKCFIFLMVLSVSDCRTSKTGDEGVCSGRGTVESCVCDAGYGGKDCEYDVTKPGTQIGECLMPDCPYGGQMVKVAVGGLGFSDTNGVCWKNMGRIKEEECSAMCCTNPDCLNSLQADEGCYFLSKSLSEESNCGSGLELKIREDFTLEAKTCVCANGSTQDNVGYWDLWYQVCNGGIDESDQAGC